MFGNSNARRLVFCGCWHVLPNRLYERQYLPLVEIDSATTILSYTARTKLVQTFTNIETADIAEAQYTFPLYDGVSVVSFKCTVGDRTIYGVVKEKQQARSEYAKAIKQGQTAGLLENLQEAGDIFTTKIGNIPAGGKVTVEIVYLGELKHDAEKDGVRFTIPTVIAPRYGPVSTDSQGKMFGLSNAINKGGIKILVDVAVEEGSMIRGLQSPSHPIAVTLGRNSIDDEDVFQTNLASATLALSGKTELDQDFVIIVNAQGQDTPRAIFETHAATPNQRALMTTLVPKFNLPNANPEIVFVVDRSGSMGGQIPLVVKALRIFLKSLPTSVKFNICSFGSRHSFLFKKSKPYDESSLNEALSHLNTFDADYGGTEMLSPVKDCVKNRLKGTPLEVMILTDGEIWNQNELFDFVNTAAKDQVRVFSLGIGSGASSSLVEGIARAGNGFAQFVHDGEQIDKRIVRMLKAAIMPFISDYSLEVVYGPEQDSEDDDDFTLVESFAESMNIVSEDMEPEKPKAPQKIISLFNSAFKEEKPDSKPKSRYDHLPRIPVPKIIQAPYKIPQLYPFTRTTVYLLFGPDSCQKCPQKVVLRGTSEHGPLELEIPVQNVGKGEMVHQLAAKKAIQDLEEGRGWLSEARTTKGKLLKDKYEGDWERIVEREAVRLGTTFQIAGKFCSFVAIEQKSQTSGDVSATMDEKKHKSALNVSAPSRNIDQEKGSGPAAFDMRSSETAQSNPHSDGSFGKGSLFANTYVSQVPRRSASAVARKQQQADSSDEDMGFGLFDDATPPPPPAPAPRGGAGTWRSNKKASSGVFGSASIPHQKSSAPGGGSLFGGMPFSRDKSVAPGGGSLFGAASTQKPAASMAATPMAFSAPAPAPAPPPAMALYSDGSSSARREKESTSRKRIATSKDQIPSLDEAEVYTEDDPEMKMHAIIGLQEFDGSWKKVAELLTVVGISQASFDAAIGTVSSSTVKATIVALAWFEAKASSEKDTWEMVADKAKSWVVGQGHADVDQLVKLMKKAFFS